MRKTLTKYLDKYRGEDGEIDSKQLWWPSKNRMLNAGKNLYQQIIRDDVEPEVNRRREHLEYSSYKQHPTYGPIDEFNNKIIEFPALINAHVRHVF